MAVTVINEKPSDEMFGYIFGCDGLMSMDEVCTFLGKDVAHDTVDRLIAENKLRAGNLRGKRGRVRICRRSLMEYVSSIEK